MLDSRLTVGQFILSLSKGGNDGVGVVNYENIKRSIVRHALKHGRKSASPLAYVEEININSLIPYSVTGLFSIAFNLASLSMPSSLVTVGTASAWPPA